MKSKQQLRGEAQTRRAKLASGIPHYSEIVARFAVALDLPVAAPVAGYWPTRGEADPRSLMRRLAQSGHPIALPCVIGNDAALAFRRWREGEPLVRNAHGVYEATADAPDIVPQTVLVPLLAFDSTGYRLGFGGGYYDRTLAHLRACGEVSAVGIAYAGQEVETLPREAHDHRLDCVVTELGVRRFES